MNADGMKIAEDLRIIHEAASNVAASDKVTLSAGTVVHLIERVSAAEQRELGAAGCAGTIWNP